MGTYQLYCFGESGNCYKAALMLELCKADWQPIFVDYFNGQTRSPEYRTQVNEIIHEDRLPIRLAKFQHQGGLVGVARFSEAIELVGPHDEAQPN